MCHNIDQEDAYIEPMYPDILKEYCFLYYQMRIVSHRPPGLCGNLLLKAFPAGCKKSQRTFLLRLNRFEADIIQGRTTDHRKEVQEIVQAAWRTPGIESSECLSRAGEWAAGCDRFYPWESKHVPGFRASGGGHGEAGGILGTAGRLWGRTSTTM